MNGVSGELLCQTCKKPLGLSLKRMARMDFDDLHRWGKERGYGFFGGSIAVGAGGVTTAFVKCSKCYPPEIRRNPKVLFTKSNKRRLVAICGPAGIGKSTWAKLIVDRLRERGEEVCHWEEDLSDPSLLEAYYQEPERWALATQLRFLTAKATIYEKALLGDVVVRAIEEDYMFARINHECGRMSKQEWSIYQEVYNRVTQHLPMPLVYVLLTAPFETVVERMKQRNRKGELDGGLEYWKKLYDAYQEWILGVMKDVPTRYIRWDVAAHDLAKHPEAVDKLATQILERVRKAESTNA